MAEVSDAQLALILDALEDAAYYRDTRSRVLDSALRRPSRRVPSARRSENDEHREKARAYTALSIELKERWRGGTRPPHQN